jgi:hypothetical protein
MEHQRARLAYEASLRALEHQQRILEGIRSRTGIVLGAASLTASFLGTRALNDGIMFASIAVTGTLGSS